MQELANTHSMRNEILSLMAQHGLENDCYLEMLDYTIDLFDSQGLGTDYYGYHNINHELEVTYVSLLALDQKKIKFTEDDKKYLYVAALFHDFDPQKSVDKPHEESVLKFISEDKKLRELLISADIDLEIIKVLILRTTYPWNGELKKNAEKATTAGSTATSCAAANASRTAATDQTSRPKSSRLGFSK